MARKSTIVWIVSAVVVTAAAVGIGIAALPDSSSTAAPAPSSTSATTPATADAGSPSSTPASSPEPASSTPASPSETPSASSSATAGPGTTVKTVTPHLTYYQFAASTSTLEVGGNVPGLVDAGGSCVVTATRGSVTVSQSFPASAQASSTECGTMRVVSSKLSTGDWNLTISYRSPRATGISAVQAVTL